MEPQIRYAKTSDGVNIAYYDIGHGAPLVVLPTVPWSDVRAEFVSMGYKLHPKLAAEHRLIRYDVRGAGLSQRGVADFSPAGLQLDLDAVINAVDLDQVNLYAEANAARIALAYAAAHSTRVDRIILWAGFARGSDFWALPRFKAVQSLFEQDWELYTETLAQVIFGLASGEPAQQYAAYMRNCVNEEEAGAHFAADLHTDVTPLLPSVISPTLLLHPSDASIAPMSWARELASSIPRAQLKVLKTSVTWSDAIEEWIVQSVGEFLSETASQGSTKIAGGLRTVLFTDIVGHTEMMQRLGDEKGRDVLRQHERITRQTLKQHGGDEIKTMGDGFMASFGSVTSALDCAIALQRAFAAHTASMPEPLHVRVGLNAGEPIDEDGDLFGSTVIMASRVCGHADAGEILIPEPVRHLLTGKSYVYADRGEMLLKGFEDAVRLYEVSWQE